MWPAPYVNAVCFIAGPTWSLLPTVSGGILLIVLRRFVRVVLHRVVRGLFLSEILLSRFRAA
jgi:hypothetical protein